MTEREKVMAKFYIFSLFIATNFLNAQNIDFGNGNIGDVSGFEDYTPYLNENLIPFTYNVLENDYLITQKIEVEYKKQTNGFTCILGNNLNLIFNRDYCLKKININGKTYKIHEVFSKLGAITENVPIVLQEVYSITIGKKNYIIISTSYNSNLNDLNSQSFTLVIEVMEKQCELIPFKLSRFSSIMNFGDFDNDNNLDYIYLENCEIEIYSYNHSKVEINKNYFLKIKCIDLTWNNKLIYIIINESRWPGLKSSQLKLLNKYN